MSSNVLAQRFILLVCLFLGAPTALAWDEDCTSFRKGVSVDGGNSWDDANSAEHAPSQIVGGGAIYRLGIRNCGMDEWMNIFVDDPALGLYEVPVLDDEGAPLRLPPMSEPFIITAESTGFAKLDQPGLCETAGIIENEATVLLIAESDTYDSVRLDDKAYVQCKDKFLKTTAFGDRVWEDLDADGIQDCTDTNGNGIVGDTDDVGSECDAGISDLPVNLLAGDCSTPLGQSVMTNANGFYRFTDLAPGNYCVEFTRPGDDFCDTDGFALGSPQFTTKNAVNDDTVDSDADTTSGISDPISLAGGDKNRTIDAGVFCPAKVGDRVWFDDGNGIQDDGELGVEGVVVELWDCGADGTAGTADDVDLFESRMTNSDGLYMFGAEPGVLDLPPGNYFLKFDPNGMNFTAPKQGDDDSTDSDCLPPSGMTACTSNLGSRGINLSRDCGLVPPPPSTCELSLNKTCMIPAKPPATAAGKCKGKLEQFTVLWTGDTINVSGVDNDAPGGVVNNNQAVTFFGTFDNNNVDVDITGTVNGQSTFHVSCSDVDFNTPDDCGKAAGNGKDNGNLINDWLVDGWVDKNNVAMSCSASTPVDEFPNLESCETSLSGADCDTLGKPNSLTFRYTGGSCPGANDQGKKTKCDDIGTLSDTVQVVITGKDSRKIMFGSDAIVTLDSPDDSFTLTRTDGKDFKARTKIELQDDMGTVLQTLDIHTSCSAALATGDVFGGLTLVAFDGNTGGSEVVYGYTVTNNGDPLTGVSLTDDTLGDIAGPFDLASGETSQFTTMATLLSTTTNIATAGGWLGNGDVCAATDTVTVQVVEPPKPPGSCDDGKPKTLIFEYTGQDCSASSHDQGNKASCTGNLNGAGPVTIEYTGKDDKKIGVTPGDESINIGDLVTLDASNKKGLKAESEIEITQSGVVLQTLEFHSSCSRPLAEGDQFGSLILRTFIPKD